jgi:hypothetical protein
MALAPISSLKTAFERKNRARGVEDFENYMHTNPGAAPGGTGKTGLNANDAAGWSKLLERQQQYLADKAELQGQAGPSVRFGGYSGGVMAGPANNPGNPAMAALRTVATGGSKLPQYPSPGGDDIGDMGDLTRGLTHGRSAEGALRALRDNGLMDQYDPELGEINLQAAKFKGRRSMISPADLYGEKANARLQYDPAVMDMERNAAYEDDISESQAASTNYWRRGQPIETDRNARAGDLARVKGEAAMMDDQVRAGASRYGADQRLAGAQSGQQSQALNALMSVLQREAGSARQYGDDDRLGQITPQLDALTQGRTGAPAQPRTGAPGAGAMTPDVASAIQKGMAAGYSREEVLAYLQQQQGGR